MTQYALGVGICKPPATSRGRDLYTPRGPQINIIRFAATVVSINIHSSCVDALLDSVMEEALVTSLSLRIVDVATRYTPAIPIVLPIDYNSHSRSMY